MDTAKDPVAAASPSPAAEPQGFWARLGALSKWQKISAALALTLMVVGAVLTLAAEPLPPDSGGSAMAANLVGQGGDQTPPNTQVPWSEAIFRYGFSFFIGFTIGYAVRSFLRLALMFCGILALAIFALEYSGFVAVQWDALDAAFSGLMQRIQDQSTEFRSFITGSLPNAGLAGFGLFAGFRKLR